ncbi:Potassium transporter 5 [Ancistrocladus abbreviatus]
MAEGIVRDDSADAEIYHSVVAAMIVRSPPEAAPTPSRRVRDSWRRTLSLAFQSIEVIYGDTRTSPLYVYASTFTNGIDDKNDILGVLSFIIYTILLLPMLKYVFIVLWANDNGDGEFISNSTYPYNYMQHLPCMRIEIDKIYFETLKFKTGGTFTLYSKLCRYAKVSMIPNYQPEDAQLSNYKLETPTKQLKRAEKIKEKLENSRVVKEVLFLVTILATSMVMGDDVLTPSISGSLGHVKQCCCMYGDGGHNMYAHSYNARDMEDKHLADYPLLCGIRSD